MKKLLPTTQPTNSLWGEPPPKNNKHIFSALVLSVVLCLTSIVSSAQLTGQYIIDPAMDYTYQDILPLSDSNFVITGQNANEELSILKINHATLQPEWQLKLNLTCVPKQIIELKNHTIVWLCNYFDTAGNYSIYIGGLSQQGVPVFSKLYNSTDGTIVSDAMCKAVPADDGFVFMGGSCAYQTFAVKCDTLGNIEWQYKYNTVANDISVRHPYGIFPEKDHYTFFDQMFAPGRQGFVAAQLDRFGDSPLWKYNRFTDTLLAYPYFTNVIRLSNGTYLNNFINQDTLITGYVCMTDTQLRAGAVRKIQHPYHLVPTLMTQLTNGNTIITCYTQLPFGTFTSYGVYLKLNLNGSISGATSTAYFPTGYPNYPDYGYGKAAVQLKDSRFVSSFGVDGLYLGSVAHLTGFAVTTDNLIGFCRDSAINVTLDTFVVPTDTLYAVNSSATHIFAHDSANLYSPLSVIYTNQCHSTATDIEELIENSASTQFTLYPNPASNTVTITIDETMLGSTLTVYDITGKKMTVVQLRSSVFGLPTTDFSNGIYFVTLENENGRTTKKLIIEK